MEKMVDRIKRQTPRIITRRRQTRAENDLTQAGIHPLLARLWATRGVRHPNEAQAGWHQLIPPHTLHHIGHAARCIADAIQDNQRFLIVADYDCDGATACAVAIRGLRAMGAQVDFLVPDRFETGYGLSPEIVRIATQHPGGKPDILLTVDNGIASIEGVQAAKQAGMQVIITDHHLPGASLPEALAIVNPNHPECNFPSKNLAGVGVIFYVMLALRAELRQRGVYAPKGGPRLNTLADLVALGTVADVVTLDANNRLLVRQGLQRMRAGQMHAGIRALFAVSGREARRATSFDLGFALGPRINAAGRLADMRIGIQCLITDDEAQAQKLAQQLDHINQQRRQIETSMRDQAFDALGDADTQVGATVAIYHPDWHQGVVGLVASRLKEAYWRPTIAFAPGDNSTLRGSGRSIPEVHLRDALDLVSKRHPGMILKFGGHAMAAGLTLASTAYEQFIPAFDQAVRTLTGKDDFEPVIETDGSLDASQANIQVAELLQTEIWGAGFPPPVFCDDFMVVHQRLLKDKHLKMVLQRSEQRYDAIWFNHNQLLPATITAAYRLDVNRWQGRVSTQLILEHAEAAG